MGDTPNIEKKSLRSARRAFWLTQLELGELIGLSQVHVSLVERGRLTLLPHQRAAVESVLGEIEWNQCYMKRSMKQCQI